MGVARLVLGGLAAAWALPAAAQSANELICFDEGGIHAPAEQIAACDAALRSGDLDVEVRPNGVAMKGWSYHELGDYDRALREYSERIRLLPDNGEGYGWRGALYYDLEEYARAVADYTVAIRLSPESPDLVLWFQTRGLALQELGQYDDSIADFDSAMGLDEEDPLSWLARGDSYLYLAEYDAFVADYTRGINLAPDVAANWNSRCWARAVWGQQLVEALDDCNEAIALDPMDFNFFDSRGLIRLRREEWAEAAADYRASLALMESASAHYGLAIALQRHGQSAGAEAEVAAAIALDPSIVETYGKYGLTPAD